MDDRAKAELDEDVRAARAQAYGNGDMPLVLASDAMGRATQYLDTGELAPLAHAVVGAAWRAYARGLSAADFIGEYVRRHDGNAEAYEKLVESQAAIEGVNLWPWMN